MDAAWSTRLAPVRPVTPSLSFFQGQGPRITQHGQREGGRGRKPGASELKPRFTGSTLSTTVRDSTAGLEPSRVLSSLPHGTPVTGIREEVGGRQWDVMNGPPRFPWEGRTIAVEEQVALAGGLAWEPPRQRSGLQSPPSLAPLEPWPVGLGPPRLSP